ncbi:Beta-glucosidase 13 [Platanthera guangdongensis]|uniref:Beta-glucosidase 13 n=1 Tax=Platanthera guangdongensis TaxID=2320717 RepID=A0ABR2M1L0_9ASPA
MAGCGRPKGEDLREGGSSGLGSYRRRGKAEIAGCRRARWCTFRQPQNDGIMPFSAGRFKLSLTKHLSQILYRMSQLLLAYNNIAAPAGFNSCGRSSVAAAPNKKRRPVFCSAENTKPAESITLNASPYNPYVSNAHAGFPPGFLFGAASSAYQVEGATTVGGRGPCIWDTFCADYPDKIADKSNGDPGAGSYYYYKRDVQLLKELGANVYRFSISWSRLLPTGHGEPNPEAIQYYKNLINELKQNALDKEYGSFLSDKIVEDYKHFADVCFKHFGDEVKLWISLNEPLTYCNGGYSLGLFAPGRCTPGLTVGGQSFVCPAGDSLTEPYIVGHNLLKAHAEVVKLYRENYQATQHGKIGITLVSNWFVPYTDSPLNKEAQKRALEFNLGWFMDPLKFGDYPFSMKSLVRDRLPQFSKEESEKLRNSYDFIGLNYYTSLYAKNKGFQLDYKPTVYADDMRVDTPGVMQVKNKELLLTKNEELMDTYREQYQSMHLHELVEAMRLGVKLKGYFVWSLQDSFEWNSGYTSKFGLTYVNNGPDVPYTDLVKEPKDSFHWYKWFISIAKVKKYFWSDGRAVPLVGGKGEKLDDEEVEEVVEEQEAEISPTPTRVSAVH